MMKNKIPVLYLCIHYRLLNTSKSKMLDRKKVLEIIRRLYHVRRKYAVIVLKEMDTFGLVKIISSGRNGEVEVLNSSIDLENTSYLYRTAGLY